MQFGIAVKPECPLNAISEIGLSAEKAGWQYVCVDDEFPGHDVWVTLSMLAATTKKVKILPSVTNPYSRHPRMTAVAA